jgi:hypothetical protein
MDRIRALGLEMRYDQEYEREWPCTDIFVTAQAIRQLEGAENWWRHLPYRTRPDEAFRYLIRVPVNSLDRENGNFDPSLSEPDMVVESCRKLTARLLLDWYGRKGAANHKSTGFRKNDRVRQTLHGPGSISTLGYEGRVLRVSRGSVYVIWDGEDERSPLVFDAQTGWERNPAVPGMSARITLIKRPKRAAKKAPDAKKSKRRPGRRKKARGRAK